MEDFSLQDFQKLAINTFGSLLTEHGFKKVKKRTDKTGSELIYTKEDLYVRIESSQHPLDYPPYFTLILGRGLPDSFNSSNNGVALWRLAKIQKPEIEPKEFRLYPTSELTNQMNNALTQLHNYGTDFLTGNLTTFKEALRDQEREMREWRANN